MELFRFVRRICCVLYVSLLGACIAVPIPKVQPEQVFGPNTSIEKTLSVASSFDSFEDITNLLGMPTVNLGPEKVFVYVWTYDVGKVAWAAAGGVFGTEPLTRSDLLFIAFDPNGKVLKLDKTSLEATETITSHVAEWIDSAGLTNLVVSPSSDQEIYRKPTVLFYRPSTSPCPFPTFDSNLFMPSVAINGTIVGDLAKGEYLAAEIEAGEHSIEIDPFPYYRFAGKESGSFELGVFNNKVTANANININSEHPVIIETYICTGLGQVVSHAVVVDYQASKNIVVGLDSAW